MRYAQIVPFEVCNGEGVGCSLFVQGCHFHCDGCFNQEAWDFDGGKEWNDDIKNKFFEIIERPYIKRVSILGGEPLTNENVYDVYNLVAEIKNKLPEKNIWIYTGYKLKAILNPVITDDINQERDRIIDIRKQTVSLCDVLVDGRYVQQLYDPTLRFRGSSNQLIWKKENGIWI